MNALTSPRRGTSRVVAGQVRPILKFSELFVLMKNHSSDKCFMRFKGLDLNLLVALEALLEEASVSRAAKRLHLSQPAASAALRRLRDWFGDPLLTAEGKRLMLTPYALRLKSQLPDLLAGIEAFASQPARFDPLMAHRRFRLSMSDFLTSVMLGPLSGAIASAAPGIELEIL
ncbi:MAG TPA: LysR family transcriptional regulator, partial [Novosphingobium sp.]